MIRKRPKNSRLEPRSCWKTRMPRLTSHIARIGPRSRPRGRSTNSDPAAGQRERVAVQHEVAGEGDHQQHLGDLAGLEAERADVDPDRAPLMVVPMPGRQRQQEQHDRGEPAGVGEALEHPVVAQQHQRGDEQRRRRASSRSAAGGRSVACRLEARSSRWMTARPSPLSAATTAAAPGRRTARRAGP